MDTQVVNMVPFLARLDYWNIVLPKEAFAMIMQNDSRAAALALLSKMLANRRVPSGLIEQAHGFNIERVRVLVGCGRKMTPVALKLLEAMPVVMMRARL